MPIYEYTCAACGTEFEELVLGRAEPDCPECGSGRITRLMSRACVHTGGGDDGDYHPDSDSSCGCGGCSGGHCASCGC
ncbi:MAG: zinc ribbon domain-containing protein [Desulfovibrio sp.]|jgi:putative FmdB family regulatory protein|nr:zinc ribbon domain-containing protein [Desulfovibrio sp.]